MKNGPQTIIDNNDGIKIIKRKIKIDGTPLENKSFAIFTTITI